MSKCLGGIIGCKYETSSWHLNGFPDGSNIGSRCLKKNLSASRLSEHPPVKGETVKTFRWNHRLQIQRLLFKEKSERI